MLRPVLELGGAARHIALLGQGLRDSGIDVLIATSPLGIRGSLPRFWDAHVVCRLSPSTPINLIRSAARLARVVSDEEVSLLHSHHRFTSMVGWLVSRLTGRPLVVTVHEFTSSHRALARFFCGDTTIVPSEALKRHLVAHYHTDPRAVATIPHGIPLTEPEEHIHSTRHAASRQAEFQPVVGFIGRLSHEKGARFFVESMPAIRLRHPSVRFTIVGEGPLESELRALAANLGLAPDVIFMGQPEDSRALPLRLDILVVPSLTEGFGLVILEAMRASLPVVASAVGGIPEVVRHGETGILVPPGSPSAIADAVTALLDRPAWANRLGQAGRKLLEDSYRAETMVERTIRAYQRALSARGNSAR